MVSGIWPSFSYERQETSALVRADARRLCPVRRRHAPRVRTSRTSTCRVVARRPGSVGRAHRQDFCGQLHQLRTLRGDRRHPRGSDLWRDDAGLPRHCTLGAHAKQPGRGRSWALWSRVLPGQRQGGVERYDGHWRALLRAVSTSTSSGTCRRK
jgi:hypothetical protein